MFGVLLIGNLDLRLIFGDLSLGEDLWVVVKMSKKADSESSISLTYFREEPR